MYGRLIKDRHFVNLDTLPVISNDLLKLNNPVNIFVINPNIILYFQSH